MEVEPCVDNCGDGPRGLDEAQDERPVISVSPEAISVTIQSDQQTIYMPTTECLGDPVIRNKNASGGGYCTVGYTETFTNKKVRLRFMRKVYGVLTTQMIVTTAIIAAFMVSETVRAFVKVNLWLYIVCVVTCVVVYVMLACCGDLRRVFPLNYILLTVLTLTVGVLLGVMTAYYETDIVLMTLGISAAVCLITTVFAMQTSVDLTPLGGVLFAVTLVLVLFGIFGLLFTSRLLQVVFSALIGLAFVTWLAFDTQRLMGNRKYALTEEEYVFGALMLYVDIIHIFLIVLNLVACSNE